MKKLMRFTCVPHPDFNGGKPYGIYVDPEHIILVERSQHQHIRIGSQEAQRVAALQLFEEVERVVAEANAMQKTVAPETEHEARQTDKWFTAREAASSLQAAYRMVSHALSQPTYHPAVECTVLQLACGTALEHGVMLARVFITETPDEVVRMLEAA